MIVAINDLSIDLWIPLTYLVINLNQSLYSEVWKMNWENELHIINSLAIKIPMMRLSEGWNWNLLFDGMEKRKSIEWQIEHIDSQFQERETLIKLNYIEKDP